MGISSTAFPNAQNPIVDHKGCITSWFLQWLTSGGLNINLNAGTGITGTLPVPNGGIGASTLTNHGLLVGSGTNPVATVAVGTTGQLLLGQTGGNPVWGATPTLAGDVLTDNGPGVAPTFQPFWFQRTTVTYTNTQIKALGDSSIALLPAPGAGLRIRVIAISFNANTLAGAYTNVNTTYADFHLSIGGDAVGYGPVNDNTVSPALTGVSNLLATANHVIYDLVQPSAGAPGPAGGLQYVQNTNALFAANEVNTALLLNMSNNGSGALTGGNAANTLKLTVYWVPEAV